ncbi:hypothetical protein, partial [Corynebacterium sp. HMSC28B08]|uniref:hypothetical protein n=1 Tax=Corynebacterium sp. HMSC28B08 TaxID=1581066 RepID=UPI001AEF4F1D
RRCCIHRLTLPCQFVGVLLHICASCGGTVLGWGDVRLRGAAVGRRGSAAMLRRNGWAAERLGDARWGWAVRQSCGGFREQPR